MSSAFLGSILALVPLVPLPTGGGGRAEFEAGLAEVRALLRDEDWARARARVIELAHAHGGEPWALAARPGLLRDLRRATYFERGSVVRFEDFWDADELDYRPRAARVRASYASIDGLDFERATVGERAVARHFAPFQGELEIELAHDAYPPDGIVLYLGLEGPAPLAVDFGRAGAPGRIVALGTGSTLARAADDRIPRPDRRFKAAVELDADGLAVRLNGKRWLAAAVAPCPGRFGLESDPAATRVELDGLVDETWVRAVLESARQHRWDLFQAAYDAEAELPPALRIATLPSFGSLPYPLDGPGPDRPGRAALQDEVYELLRIGEGTGAIDWLRRLEPGATEPVFRTWLLALSHLSADRLETALRYLDDVVRAQPDFAAARLFRGVVHLQREAWGAAASDYAAALADLDRADSAGEVERLQRGFALQQLALCELQCGRLDRARERIESATANGLYGRELDQVNELLAKAERGPSWQRDFEVTTAHYRVQSNVDRRSAIETARALETALERFSRAIRPVDVEPGREFRVFVFADEAGYQQYLADLFGQRRENTAGLYTPALGQLLIRHLPDARTTDRTIRHEGFHQYFDLVCDDPPVWLNEGLAEYWETADFTKSASRMIGLNRAHLQRIPDVSLTLGELFALTPAEFYGHGGDAYALSWGVVYWLQHSDDEARARLEGLIAALADSEPAAAALASAFPSGELERLERECRAFLADL